MHGLTEITDKKQSPIYAPYFLRRYHFIRLETVLPGLYTGRTMHIHVKVSQPGGRVLTTQIYFNGVARNQSDRIFTPSLATTLTDAPDGSKQATFNFVL